MVRFITLAALAAAIAGPASAEGVRVSLASKTPDQIAADVTAAARQVCLRATASETFRVEALDRCVKDTVKSTMAQVKGAMPAAKAGDELAQR